MKTVIDLQGNEIEVSDDTMCKAGVDGGLPRLYTEQELDIISSEQAEKESAYQAAIAERQAKAYIEKRMAEYGSIEKQIEFITEFGLDAWQAKIATIKAKYPKGE